MPVLVGEWVFIDGTLSTPPLWRYAGPLQARRGSTAAKDTMELGTTFLECAGLGA